MQKNMAGELWNRVNIPFPSVVSSVRIQFNSTTDANVKSLLVENDTVLKLLRSEILQTEIRVLYDLMYVLNNSFRANKTFKGLLQVEQCINRLKNMKLDAALQELTELCPNRIQRELSIKSGECDVPSQPFLEWLCLKVLGAAQLMCCMLSRCSRAFIRSKQQMNLEEFVILNMVLTSMLSRFWVIFRGILLGLSTLYQRLLVLLREVANSRPMPFLTDFSLPADMTQFLGPSEASLLKKLARHIPQAKDSREEQGKRRETSSVKVQKQGQTRKIKEDFGVPLERDMVLDIDLKPFLSVFKTATEGTSSQQQTRKNDKRQALKKQMREAESFTDMESQLEEMIAWCKSHKMKKEKRLLNFLRLKCRRMKHLEADGYNVQRKLRTFKQEADWASSPLGSAPKTCRLPAAMRRKAHLMTRFHSLRSRFKSTAIRGGFKKKPLKGQRKRTDLSVSRLTGDNQKNRTTYEMTSQTSDHDSHDDIDDIFASAGL